MNISEGVSFIIAIISLIISIYVVLRDQKEKRFDLLMNMYDRLESANAELQLQTEKELAQKAQWKLERELETACFMLYKRKINKTSFFHLYSDWLLERQRIWITDRKDMLGAGNHPYTIWAIKMGLEKGYLNNSKHKQKFLKEITNYVVERKKN